MVIVYIFQRQKKLFKSITITTCARLVDVSLASKKLEEAQTSAINFAKWLSTCYLKIPSKWDNHFLVKHQRVLSHLENNVSTLYSEFVYVRFRVKQPTVLRPPCMLVMFATNLPARRLVGWILYRVGAAKNQRSVKLVHRRLADKVFIIIVNKKRDHL